MKLIDPFEFALLMAEPDEEPFTDDDRRALAASEAREQRGEPGVSHEDVLRELGISESDLCWPPMNTDARR